MSRLLSPNHGLFNLTGLEKIQKVKISSLLYIVVKLSLNLSGENEHFPEMPLRVPRRNSTGVSSLIDLEVHEGWNINHVHITRAR